MIITLVIVLGSYLLFLLFLITGWNKFNREIQVVNREPEPMITVIIPARNESKTIWRILNVLLTQEYPNFEILVVDDHSEDSTRDKVLEYQKDSDRIFYLRNEGTGKKAAITTGVMHSRAEIIITTDADCYTVQRLWLKAISKHFTKDVNMIAAGVRINQNGSFTADLQAIEFASLVGTSASTLSLGFPTMCNGANLAFRKSAFMEVGGYKENLHIPSGDDEFLMRKFHEQFPGSVMFLNAWVSVITTDPVPSVREFLWQRLRWAGKWDHNSSILTRMIAVFVLVIQLSIITSFVVAPVVGSFALAGLLTMRLIMEGWFLFQVRKFLGIRWNTIAFLALQILYPIYVIVIGIGSRFVPYSWKGRRSSGQSVS